VFFVIRERVSKRRRERMGLGLDLGLGLGVKIYPQTMLVTGKTIEDHVHTLNSQMMRQGRAVMASA